MRFRPCIDIHNGKVKQIVGGSLRDEGDQAKENFVSTQDAAFFAEMYQKDRISGGHVILLNAKDSPFYEKTKERDLAIITLLLGTGIRVSELVGLNVDDVDFRNNGLHLIRKGRKEMTVYFGNEVADALEQYMEGSRKLVIPKEGHEDALFYSMQRRRIGVQAVQNLVKKYAKEVTPLKKITPHKLRSTYGTALYQETDDIYLVAEVLGHSDVNTTRKHYAAMSDTRRRQAAGKVVLRESASHDVDGQKH